jgi:hypothetical protein
MTVRVTCHCGAVELRVKLADGPNMGGIDGVNPAEFEPIDWNDGVNHPSDRKA